MQGKQGSTYSKKSERPTCGWVQLWEGWNIPEKEKKGQHVGAYEDGTRGIGA